MTSKELRVQIRLTIIELTVNEKIKKGKSKLNVGTEMFTLIKLNQRIREKIAFESSIIYIESMTMNQLFLNYLG